MTTLVPVPEVTDAGIGIRGRVVSPGAAACAKRATVTKSREARVVYRKESNLNKGTGKGALAVARGLQLE